jgi:hypothetical protein
VHGMTANEKNASQSVAAFLESDEAYSALIRVCQGSRTLVAGGEMSSCNDISQLIVSLTRARMHRIRNLRGVQSDNRATSVSPIPLGMPRDALSPGRWCVDTR